MVHLMTPILATAQGQMDAGGTIALIFAIVLVLLFVLACGYAIRFLIATFDCADPGPMCLVNYDGSYPSVARRYVEAPTIKMTSVSEDQIPLFED